MESVQSRSRKEKSVPKKNVAESVQSRNIPLVDAVSPSVSSDLESSEMPRDPEPIQISGNQEPNHKHVPNADDKSNLTQWKKGDTPLLASDERDDGRHLSSENVYSSEVPDEEQPSSVGSKKQGTNQNMESTAAKVACTGLEAKTTSVVQNSGNVDTKLLSEADVGARISVKSLEIELIGRSANEESATCGILQSLLLNVITEEWDNLYKATLGEWKDEPRNGLDFWNGESPRNQERNAHMLRTMLNGNRAEWDCTSLFYAILFSDCINSLNPTVRSNVDNLRKFQKEFAHMPQCRLSDVEFQNAISKVHAAFLALGISTLQIQVIRNRTSFTTEELRSVLKKVDDLKKELQEKETNLQEKEEQRQVFEDQLQSDISPFCILPPKPSHDVAGRNSEVTEITQRLKELKSANENNLSYLYISGNPGSGKSQLAGLVAKRFFDEVKEIPSAAAASFVMTLNAESPDTLLESYVSFARHLKCPEYAVTTIVNSKDLKTDEKITNLQALISTKIELYTSWLLVVDNATSISGVHAHLPESGNEQWARGQLLITTQDTASIPSTNSFIQHISVSKGMEPHDASSLLAMLSGIASSEIEKEVAQALDYQPLALASAAIYVRQVRQNKSTSNFGWNFFLKILDTGQRESTEVILAETNPSYPHTMTVAIILAVQKMTSDKVIFHTLRFLHLSALQSIRLDIVINYILNVDEETKDEEMILMRIQRCSLLLLEEEESGVYIRAHRIVLDVFKQIFHDDQEGQVLKDQFLSKRSIPLYILARGDEAKAAFQRALEIGKTKDKRVKVLLIGQDRVGKTSVVRSLKGEEFRKDESSTDGVQMDIPLKHVGAKPWKNSTDEQEMTAFDHKSALYVRKALGKEDITEKIAELSVDDEIHEPQEKKTTTKDVATHVTQDAAEPESYYGNPDEISSKKREKTKRKDDIPDKVTRLAIKNLSQEKSDNDDGIWPVIWDFAGQAIFVPFIPSSCQGK
ncbi:hypothetical protein OS493_036555 [Desmophyllum pertusum]|uniref:Uncharacterized protein n=1 Tax=Desmophyllum pertusum TaxID=174260 RepID=A0A9W9YW00_9CNID|nr:hypothetical protein OS493_036555 [Desmophyllum pertusum]